MKQSILIVEDDKKIVNLVKAYLENADYNIKVANTLKEAKESLYKYSIDLVILDLMLPDGSGEFFMEDIKSFGDIPVIMLTARASEEEKIAGFSLGADDYVTKPFSPRELLARVRAVLKRKNSKRFFKSSFNDGQFIINESSYEVILSGEVITFTPTEFKMLLVLTKEPNRVFSREELVNKALGYQFEGYERTIDAHIKNIRHKLNDDPKMPRFIQTVHGIGYRFCGKKDEN